MNTRLSEEACVALLVGATRGGKVWPTRAAEQERVSRILFLLRSLCEHDPDYRILLGIVEACEAYEAGKPS